MRNLDDGSSVSGSKLFAKSGVCDGKVATNVKMLFLAGNEREALKCNLVTTSACGILGVPRGSF